MKNRLIFLFAISILSLSSFSQNFKVGDKAPEIIQNSLTGEELKLSDLQGKMVLIDFWAAWCKPCRKENPNIVQAYHTFKDKSFKNAEGFTVFSVSLDFKKELWKNAVNKDQLTWQYHVSDLKGWKNQAALKYGIRSIPASFLIDGDGIIIGINLRGEDLEKKLKKQLKKKSFFSSKN